MPSPTAAHPGAAYWLDYLAYTYGEGTGLADRSVCIIGSGPLGGRIAETLLEHGIGRIRFLDGQSAPSPHGSSRRSAAAGEEPVDGARGNRLRDPGHDAVEYDGTAVDHRALKGPIEDSDLAVLALEQPDVRLAHVVNRYCLEVGRRWIHAALDGNLGVVGPLFVPEVTACYNDFRTLSDAATPNSHMSRVYRRYAAQRGAASFSPGLPAHADIVGGFTSLGIVHWLLTGTCFVLGRVFTLNFDGMMIDVEDVLKLPRCPVCGRWRFAYEPPFSAEAVTRAPADGEVR